MTSSDVPPLRRQQVELTRELILEAVAKRLEHDDPASISVPEIAEAAGVSLRTVYRYFPTREELLAASAEWINERMFGGLGYAESIDELLVHIPQAFERFGDHPRLVRTMALTEVGRSVRASRRQQRLEAMRKALAEVTEGLPSGERRRAEAVIGALYDMAAWVSMHEEAGLDGREAGEAVVWAVETLLDDLRRRSKGKSRRKG
jgi:AcrR family transcriptional regulator